MMHLQEIDPASVPQLAFGAWRALMLRGGLALVMIACSLFALSCRKLFEAPSRSFDRLILGFMVVSRLALFILTFFILHIAPRGDIVTYYWGQANAALAGQLPYRDFQSSYAPLHSLLDAGLLRIAHTPRMFILASMVAEWLLVFFWLRIGRSLFTEARFRRTAILYATSAFSVQFVTIDGQNTVIAGMFVALAVLLLLRYRALWSGLALGFGIAAIKFLPLVFSPLFFLQAQGRERWKWVAGFVVGCVPIYALYVHLGCPILRPLTDEGALRTSSNLPFLLESLFGFTIPSHLIDGTLVLSFLVVFALVFFRTRESTQEVRVRALSFALAAITIALVLFAKKSWSTYFLLALFPLCATIPAGRLRTWLFAGFTFVGIMEQSVWAWWLDSCGSYRVHQYLVHGQLQASFLIIEVLLLAGLGWVLYQAVRQIGTSTADDRE